MRIMRKLGMVAVAVLSVGALAPAPASADSFTVTTTADSVDGSCTATLCSLRDAVIAADAATGNSTISVPPGTYKLTIAPVGADDNTTGDLNITNGVTINGAGAGQTTVDANFIDRAFNVQSSGTAVITGMTIENGRPGATGNITACPSTPPSTAGGGAILVTGALTLKDDVLTGNLSAGSGGAVEAGNSGPVDVTGTQFTNNVACPSTGTGSSTNEHYGFGAGLNYDDGSQLTLDRDTFSGGQTPADGGGLAIEGFAAFAKRQANPQPPSAYEITNTTFEKNTSAFYGGGAFIETASSPPTFAGDTFTGNSTTGTDPTLSAGGGLYEETNSTLTLVNSTVTGNTAPTGGGVGAAAATINLRFDTITGNTGTSGTGNIGSPGGGTFNLDDSIVTGGVGTDNTPSNCSGTVNDRGYNLFDDTSDSGAQCGSAPGDHDVITASPGVQSLADNGGPTQTEALAPASPAIDTANDTLCTSETLDVDQRGVARPIGAHCDIGAFEYGGADLALAASAAKSSIAVGGQDTVTDTVTNAGPSYATGVKFTDPGAGYTVVSVTPSQGTCTTSGTAVSCDLGTLAPGAKATVSVVVAATSTGTLSLTSNVSADQGDATPADNTATVSVTVGSSGPGSGGPADLAILKTASAKVAQVGHDFTYTLTVTNHGPNSATSVVVTDSLPSSVKLLSTGGACSGKTKLSCAVGTLANGATRRLHVHVQALRAGSVTNTAKVASAASDPNLSNNRSTARIKLVVPATCSGPLVFRTGFDPDDEVVLIRIYVNSKLTRTYHASYRQVTVAPPHKLRSFRIRVVFTLNDQQMQSSTLSRSYSGCSAGPTSTRNTNPPGHYGEV